MKLYVQNAHSEQNFNIFTNKLSTDLNQNNLKWTKIF